MKHRIKRIVFVNLLFIAPYQYVLAVQDSSLSSVSGIVRDEEKRPLPNAQVFIEATSLGDITDTEGRFIIENLPAGDCVLVVKYLGYSTYREGIRVESGSSISKIIELQPAVIDLEDVVVTASRTARKPFDLPQFVQHIPRSRIETLSVQQTPEILRFTPGVVLQKTNQGGGSPIIRGFRANKLLFLIDGIRLNNTTYRGGNLQYLNSVSSNNIAHIDVVHGPNSVLYGSDALGGVINILTEEPEFDERGDSRVSGQVKALCSSANRGTGANLNLNLSTPRWAASFAGSIDRFGDVTRGSRGGEELMQRLAGDTRVDRRLSRVQSPNGYRVYDFAVKTRFKISPIRQLIAAFMLNHQSAVPRYDSVEAGIDSVRMIDPQERLLFYLRYRCRRRTVLRDNLEATMSFHRQSEKDIRIKSNSLTREADWIQTDQFGVQVQLNKRLFGTHSFNYGYEFYYDDVSTDSYEEALLSTRDKQYRIPLFPDGSSHFTTGFFAQDEFFPAEKLRTAAGVRLSSSILEAPFQKSYGGDFTDLRQRTDALTIRVGGSYEVTGSSRIVANIAQGFRTPNLYDMAKLGAGKGGVLFEVPNTNLEPEKVLSLDGGLKVRGPAWFIDLSVFYNYIEQLLERKPATYRGASYYIEGDDTLKVYRKENVGLADIKGFALGAGYAVGLFDLFATLSQTIGRDRTGHEPLSAIPPLNGLFGIRYNKRKIRLELLYRFAGAQTRLSSIDELDLRIPQGGTPAWQTVSLYFGFEFLRGQNVDFAVENVFDRNYREYLSGLNAPGRNAKISYRYSF